MQLVIKKGNIFDSECECITNPTNSLGVMGAGLAKQFLDKYPVVCEEVNKLQREAQVQYLNTHKTIELGLYKLLPPVIIKTTPHWICFFPTKIDWRNSSQYIYIEKNLLILKNMLKEQGVKSIALPQLGCGHGGLEWSGVKEIILRVLDEYNGTVELYE